MQFLDVEACRDACWVRNSLHLLAFLNPGHADIDEQDRWMIVEISMRNIALSKRTDGGFARRAQQDFGVTVGCSQAMKTRDALRQLVGLPDEPFPGGRDFVQSRD